MSSIVERLCDQGLVIQHPERKQIADLLEQQAARIAELGSECDNLKAENLHLIQVNTGLINQLATLHKRIDDAPIIVVNVGASYILDRPGVYRLISKEDLQK